MKIKVIILTISLVTFSIMARVIGPFLGWDRLKEASPDIIVAHCGKPAPPTPGVIAISAPKFDSEIQIMLALKGENNITSARLQTDHELRQGENYLVFGCHDGGVYQAYEEYRVVPLGAKFSINSIAGKLLDEQLQILFKKRIDDLNQEIRNDEAEKLRLEEGLRK